MSMSTWCNSTSSKSKWCFAPSSHSLYLLKSPVTLLGMRALRQFQMVDHKGIGEVKNSNCGRSHKLERRLQFVQIDHCQVVRPLSCSLVDALGQLSTTSFYHSSPGVNFLKLLAKEGELSHRRKRIQRTMEWPSSDGMLQKAIIS